MGKNLVMRYHISGRMESIEVDHEFVACHISNWFKRLILSVDSSLECYYFQEFIRQ
jgi:hypothetical protein